MRSRQIGLAESYGNGYVVSDTLLDRELAAELETGSRLPDTPPDTTQLDSTCSVAYRGGG